VSIRITYLKHYANKGYTQIISKFRKLNFRENNILNHLYKKQSCNYIVATFCNLINMQNSIK